MFLLYENAKFICATLLRFRTFSHVHLKPSSARYCIADKTYKLHITVQDAAAKPEFDKYVVTVNGKEAALKKVGTAYTLASLTQFDTLEIEAFVKNIDDTAVFEWTRGAGLAKIQIEGTTAKVTVDTSSTVMGQYMINATVTCGGASFKLPTIRVQKVNALKLATPEIIGQPVSASYGQGQSPKALQVMVKNDAGAGNLQCNWYTVTSRSSRSITNCSMKPWNGTTPSRHALTDGSRITMKRSAPANRRSRFMS